jgi:hypothetical protein
MPFLPNNSHSPRGRPCPLRQTTIATACVYLHRFFSRHSFAKHRDIVVVCGACIFLACKVEESRRKVSFLIERLRATVDPAAAALHPEAPEFVRMRDAIFDCERDVLDTIEYRLHVCVRVCARAGRRCSFVWSFSISGPMRFALKMHALYCKSPRQRKLVDWSCSNLFQLRFSCY